MPSEFKPYIDRWFSEFEKLRKTLSAYINPIGEYFTSAHTNNLTGDILIYGLDVAKIAPHYLMDLIENMEKRKNIFYFCAEKSHIHELAQKLPTILRLGKINNVYVLTKDGSPHDVQMHTLTEEVAENMNFGGNIGHYVVEKGKMHEVSRKAIRKSRHLSEIEQTLENEAKASKVSIILGSRKDEPAVVNSELLQLFDNAGIDYEYSIISSDRNPEALQAYCQNLSSDVKVIIAVAGLIPNLPIVAKSWSPQIPVISVPLVGDGYEPKDILLASTSTPGERPVIVTGIGKNGLQKAGFLVLEMLGIMDEKIKRKYLELQDIKKPEIMTQLKR